MDVTDNSVWPGALLVDSSPLPLYPCPCALNTLLVSTAPFGSVVHTPTLSDGWHPSRTTLRPCRPRSPRRACRSRRFLRVWLCLISSVPFDRRALSKGVPYRRGHYPPAPRLAAVKRLGCRRARTRIIPCLVTPDRLKTVNKRNGRVWYSIGRPTCHFLPPVPTALAGSALPGNHSRPFRWCAIGRSGRRRTTSQRYARPCASFGLSVFKDRAGPTRPAPPYWPDT